MIKVFGQTDTDFSSNGDIVVQPYKARIKKEDNGDFSLTLECGLEYQDYITERRIIVANTPQGEQAFRIHNVTKTGNKISATCPHVFYDTLYFAMVYAIYPTSTVETFNHFLNRLNDSIFPPSNFTVDSDITESTFFEYHDMRYCEILMDLVSRFNGHLVRDNFSFEINSSIGEDNGITIRYGSNLKSLSVVENWDNVCTRLSARGKDGARLTRYPTQPYPFEYTKIINFNQDNIYRDWYQSDSDYQAALQTNLALQADAYMAKHMVPEITYTLKTMIDFEADIGDTIRVIDERLGMDFLTSVLSYEYDCIAERYIDIVFGTHQKTAKGLGNKVDDIESNLGIAWINNKQLIYNSDNTVSWSD